MSQSHLNLGEVPVLTPSPISTNDMTAPSQETCDCGSSDIRVYALNSVSFRFMKIKNT